VEPIQLGYSVFFLSHPSTIPIFQIFDPILPPFYYSIIPLYTLLLELHFRIMAPEFLALVGVSLFDPETAL